MLVILYLLVPQVYFDFAFLASYLFYPLLSAGAPILGNNGMPNLLLGAD